MFCAGECLKKSVLFATKLLLLSEHSQDFVESCGQKLGWDFMLSLLTVIDNERHCTDVLIISARIACCCANFYGVCVDKNSRCYCNNIDSEYC